MIRVIRITPDIDVTMEITAPRTAWTCLVQKLGVDPEVRYTSENQELFGEITRQILEG